MGAISTMKPFHMKKGDDKTVGEFVHQKLQTDFADLQGGDKAKCEDDALVEAVRKKMRWEKPPAKGWLFTVLCQHRARAEAPAAKPRRRRGPPKKRGPPSPSPPAAAKRSTPAPAESMPLADQGPNAGALVVATAAAPSQLAQFRALVERAEMACAGEKVVQVGGGRKKAVEIHRVGDKKWRTFASRTDAAAAFSGISGPDVTKLCNKTAGSTLLAKGLEARYVDEGVSMSKSVPYALVLRAARLRFRQADVSSDADALRVVQRAAWEVNGQPPPESWMDALKSLRKFNESQLSKFAAATGEAEEARVHQAYAANLTGAARLAQIESRRAASAANARANIEAMKDMIARGYFNEDTGDLIVGLRADHRAIEILYLDPNAPVDDGPVMIKVNGKEVQLKGGPSIERYALAPGNLVLAQRGVRVATLYRPTPNVVTWLTAPFARGTSGYTHGGEGGPYAGTITPQQEPGDFVRGLAFNPLAAMAKVGFHAVRGTRTEAISYDGDSIGGAGTLEFELFLPGFEGDLMPALDDEMFWFSQALIATSRDEPRLVEGVDVSYRRDVQGTGRSPAFLLAQPCRAETGPTLRTLRGLEYLRTNGFPIMYEVARRCNWHCVRFELVAYRDVVPTRVRLHVDSMAELSISAGGLTSAALATA